MFPSRTVPLNHIIESQQFSREDLEALFVRAKEMERIVLHEGCCDLLHSKILVVLFYQPSTRTRLSFETAMVRMGGRYVSTENALDFSSHAKGESLEDTIKTVSGYGDVIVLRYHKEGGARRAANVSSVPVINAGDGPGQHPTQALLDVYTIQKELGSLDGIKVAFVGDLKYSRTVHSLAYLLAKFQIKQLYFVAPEVTQIPENITQYLARHGVSFVTASHLREVAHDVDVVYTTRVQQEYFPDPLQCQEAQGKYVLNDEVLAALKRDAIIMHPLPRNDEIPYKVDLDPRARYFQQVRNGLYIRMALLELLLAG